MGVAGSNPVGPIFLNRPKINQSELYSPCNASLISHESVELLRENSAKKRPSSNLSCNTNHLLTTQEARRLLRVSSTTIRKWCEKGKLEAFKTQYGKRQTWLISKASVQLYLNQKAVIKQTKEAISDSHSDKCTATSTGFKQWLRALGQGTHKGRVYSVRTVELYRSNLEPFISQLGEKQLTYGHVKQWMDRLPAEQFGKRQHFHRAVTCFVSYLNHEQPSYGELLTLLKDLRPKRHKPAKRLSLNEAELELLVGACKDSNEQLLVLLFAHTGLRVSEACTLIGEDIDLKAGVLTVKEGKWGKRRRVGLSKQLKDHLSKQGLLKAHCPLLMNSAGNRTDRYAVRRKLVTIGKRVGLKVSPHALRRAFVTINAHKGRPLPMLQLACGHSDIGTTRSYCMTSEDDVIQAMHGW